MQGFVHGPVSGTSSTAQQSGVIVMLSPGQVIAGSEPPAPVLAALRLHFIPEPRFVLLLGSGIAGLVVIGRHRMRK